MRELILVALFYVLMAIAFVGVTVYTLNKFANNHPYSTIDK